jgi:hypothetical protein
MDTAAVLISMLTEMKKMSHMNTMLLSIIEQQTEMIKEQKEILYSIQATLSVLQQQQYR